LVKQKPTKMMCQFLGHPVYVDSCGRRQSLVQSCCDTGSGARKQKTNVMHSMTPIDDGCSIEIYGRTYVCESGH